MRGEKAPFCSAPSDKYHTPLRETQFWKAGPIEGRPSIDSTAAPSLPAGVGVAPDPVSRNKLGRGGLLWRRRGGCRQAWLAGRQSPPAQLTVSDVVHPPAVHRQHLCRDPS